MGVSADELAEPAGYLLLQLWDLQPSLVSDFVSKRQLQPVLEHTSPPFRTDRHDPPGT